MTLITTTINELRDGDSVSFDMPDSRTEWLTLRKVWRYDDGSIVLEFKGREPGLWRYADKDLLLPVTIRTRSTA